MLSVEALHPAAIAICMLSCHMSFCLHFLSTADAVLSLLNSLLGKCFCVLWFVFWLVTLPNLVWFWLGVLTKSFSPLQVRLLAKHTDHETEEIEKVISRPKYFDPHEAVKFGIIDKVTSLQLLFALECKHRSRRLFLLCFHSWYSFRS